MEAIIGGKFIKIHNQLLAAAGHTHGKDSIFAAMLLIEMIATLGERISVLFDEIQEKLGKPYMLEREYSFTQEKNAKILKLLFDEKSILNSKFKVLGVSYEEGLKICIYSGSGLFVGGLESFFFCVK